MRHLNLSQWFISLFLVGLVIYCFKPKHEELAPKRTPAVATVDDSEDAIKDLATANGFDVSDRIVNAILTASKTYQIDAMELTAIGIIETGLGKYARTRKNLNGTVDRGLFQINSVNETACIEYNLDSPEGSALCAAKLLSQIKTKYADYLGRYHSNTPVKKVQYFKKITKVLASQSDESLTAKTKGIK